MPGIGWGQCCCCSAWHGLQGSELSMIGPIGLRVYHLWEVSWKSFVDSFTVLCTDYASAWSLTTLDVTLRRGLALFLGIFVVARLGTFLPTH